MNDIDYAAWNEWVVGEFHSKAGAVPGYEELPLLLLTTTGSLSSEPRGKITKQGSKLVRWAALEAIVCYHGPPLRDGFHRIAERRGTNKARIATARRLMTLVYYGLRDGEIRCLPRAAA
jgi:hypothetical protein